MATAVYLRTAPPFPFGAVPRDEPRAFLLETGVDAAQLGAHEGKAYLMVATPFDAVLELDLPGPPFPFGGVPRRTPLATTLQGTEATIYPAATGNAARSTANDDTPAATWVPGKLSGDFNYELAISASVGPSGSQGGGALGILELADPDGELDDLRTLGWDGAPIELRRGEPEAYFSTYSTVAKLSAAGIRYNLQRKEILLRDLAWRLNQAELHGERHAGTGGVEGDATLKGRIKPIAFGSVFNITPVQISAALLVYQVSCTSVLGIDAVKDGGADITPGSDYATYEDLVSATVSAGTYATCEALGLFRLGSAPVYAITADVRGDNDTRNGLTYPHTRAQIARRIATGRGNIRLRDPQDLDGTAFADLDQWQSGTIGRFYDAEITKAAALTDLLNGCAGWWSVGLDGRLAVGQVEDPETQAAAFTLDFDGDGGSEVRVDAPSMTDWQPPRRSTLMGWSRNYTPLAVNQIAGAVSQADAAVLQADSRLATSESLWVSSSYPSSPVVVVDGGFADEADAQLEADRQRRLFGQVREIFQLPVVMDPFLPVVGRVVAIANANRLGLGTLAKAFCFGVAVNANGKPILRLWR